MADIEDIRDQLISFSQQYGPSAIMPAVVNAINDDGTVSVEFADGSTVDDVRLKAIVGIGNQFLITPSVGSEVMVGRISNSEDYLLIAASGIDKVEIEIGNTKLSISDKFELKAGSEDLLIILKDLIQAMIDERHMTNTGPTISLTAASVLTYNNIKARFENLLKSS